MRRDLAARTKCRERAIKSALPLIVEACKTLLERGVVVVVVEVGVGGGGRGMEPIKELQKVRWGLGWGE